MNGALVSIIDCNDSTVSGVCFTPSGRHFVVGRSDAHVVVYNNSSLGEVGRSVKPGTLNYKLSAIKFTVDYEV